MVLSKQNKFHTLTGTLGTVAQQTGIDYTWLRIIFVVCVIFSKGAAILLYLAAALALLIFNKKGPMSNSWRSDPSRETLRHIQFLHRKRQISREWWEPYLDNIRGSPKV